MLISGYDSDAKILVEEDNGVINALAIHRCIMRHHQLGPLQSELELIDRSPDSTADWRHRDPFAVKRVVSWLYFAYQSGDTIFLGAIAPVSPSAADDTDGQHRMMGGEEHHMATFLLATEFGLGDLARNALDDFHQAAKVWWQAAAGLRDDEHDGPGDDDMPAFITDGIDAIYGSRLEDPELKNAGQALVEIIVQYPAIFRSAEIQACLRRHAAFGADVVHAVATVVADAPPSTPAGDGASGCGTSRQHPAAARAGDARSPGWRPLARSESPSVDESAAGVVTQLLWGKISAWNPFD